MRFFFFPQAREASRAWKKKNKILVAGRWPPTAASRRRTGCGLEQRRSSRQGRCCGTASVPRGLGQRIERRCACRTRAKRTMTYAHCAAAMRTAAALLLMNATLGATIGMGSVPLRAVHRNLRLRGGFPDAAGVAAGKLSALSTRALSPQQRRLGSVRPAYLLRRHVLSRTSETRSWR